MDMQFIEKTDNADIFEALSVKCQDLTPFSFEIAEQLRKELSELQNENNPTTIQRKTEILTLLLNNTNSDINMFDNALARDPSDDRELNIVYPPDEVLQECLTNSKDEASKLITQLAELKLNINSVENIPQAHGFSQVKLPPPPIIFSRPDQVQQRSYKKRLFIGEADFSYTVAILNKHKKDKPGLDQFIVATELESEDTLAKKSYPDTFPINRAYLQKTNVKLLYKVNGTLLHEHPILKNEKFKRIQFNFPHDLSEFTTRNLAKLVHRFFASASQLQELGDQIQVTACFNKPMYYQAWLGLYDASVASHYCLIKRRKFNSSRYPCYRHKKTAANVSVTNEGIEYIFKKTSLSEKEIRKQVLIKKENIYQKSYNCFVNDQLYSDSSDYNDSDDEKKIARPSIK